MTELPVLGQLFLSTKLSGVPDYQVPDWWNSVFGRILTSESYVQEEHKRRLNFGCFLPW